MSNTVTVRGLYKTIAKTKTHLVQSREIATTCVCPYLFKMSYPFGVSEGERDYLAANTTHDIMSIALPTTILDNWQMRAKKFEWVGIAEKIEKDSQEIIEKAISNAQEKIKTEEKALPSKDFSVEGFQADVEYRFHGLLVGIAKRLMAHYEQPKRALTEVTISNVNEHHEGRLDASLEFYNREYGVLDWKTNNVNQASTGGKDRWQLISNILLANYRYSGDENSWNKFRFGAVVYHQKAYLPDLPLQQDWIDKVKNDRQFAYEVLCGGRPHTQKPQFCPICDKGGESSSECQFYRKDSRLAYEGRLPPEYARIRAQLIKRRYLVLDERAETHKHKFVIQMQERTQEVKQQNRRKIVVQQPMSYNWGRRRNRLRKGKRGMNTSYGYSPRSTYRPVYNKDRRHTPEWGALHRAWVAYVIAKSQDDYEKMRKYAIVIRKFQRRLNIAISDFPDIGVYGFEEDFENKEEDDDSKLTVYDPWSRERIEDPREDQDEDDDS